MGSKQSTPSKIDYNEYLNLLPKDVLFLVLHFLDVPSLVQLSRANKITHKLTNEDHMYGTFYRFTAQLEEKIGSKYSLSTTLINANSRFWNHRRFTSLNPKANDGNQSRSLLQKLPSLFKNKRLWICMIGLENAGKSKLLYFMGIPYLYGMIGLCFQSVIRKGFPMEKLDVKGKELGLVEILSWDVTENQRVCEMMNIIKKVRPLWKHYLQASSGVIYVVDSSNHQELAEKAIEPLHYIVDNEHLPPNTPILIMATKQDLPNALSPIEVALLFSEVIAKYPNRPILVQTNDPTMQGFYKGMQWLSSHVRSSSINL